MSDYLKGRTIVDVRTQTAEEQAYEGWNEPAVVLVLDNGTLLYPARDPEGNDSGALFGHAGSEYFSVIGSN